MPGLLYMACSFPFLIAGPQHQSGLAWSNSLSGAGRLHYLRIVYLIWTPCFDTSRTCHLWRQLLNGRILLQRCPVINWADSCKPPSNANCSYTWVWRRGDSRESWQWSGWRFKHLPLMEQLIILGTIKDTSRTDLHELDWEFRYFFCTVQYGMIQVLEVSVYCSCKSRQYMDSCLTTSQCV